VGGLSVLATLFLLLVASPASATSLARAKAQARAVSAQVGALDLQVDQTVNACAAAVQRLAAVQAHVRANRAALDLERYQFTLAEQALAQHLVLAYKGGGEGVLNALLQAGSFSDLLTRLDYVQHLTGDDATLVQTVRQHRSQLDATGEALQKELDSSAKTAADLTAARDRLLTQLSTRRALLRGLNGTVARLVAARRTVTPVATTAASSPTPPSTAGDGGGPWWPAIKSAAAANGIWAEGLYRLMMAESQGSATASNGIDLGLYQYAPDTWKGSWNPWRSASIFDGDAQIKATALAVHLGYGPSWWPTTYPWAFSRQ
jgi:hypothetical protein